MPKIRGPCTLQGCDHPHYGKGYCSKHYQRWKRHGSPEPDDFRCRYDSPEQSFAARTTPSGDCLLWTGSTTRRGYGVTTDHGRRLMAHHYAWEQAGNPPVPDGMFLDHECHVESCVEVSHLRLATRSQNNAHRRGAQSNGSSGHRGVTWSKRASKWQASCQGKYLGTFEDIEDAASAASAARREVYGEFAGKGEADMRLPLSHR